ncbi:MAG: LCP family protein [Clostridiales bacterium]|nr:LCP family protein [Clostridiales bacterium]
MTNRKTSLIWTVLIMLAAISIIAAACFYSRSGSGTGAVEAIPSTCVSQTAEDPASTGEDGFDAEAGLPLEEVEDTRLVTGKTCSGSLVAEGSKNILILGEDKVSFLYDTIGIVSIDSKGGILEIIMIPRDFYIQYNQKTLDLIAEDGKADEPGIYKINYTHHVGTLLKYEGRFNSSSISYLADVVEAKFGIHLDDYVKVNLSGFKSLIDTMGGVEITVPYDMNYDDPVQDLHIHLKKGTQLLDGEGAEGFARFRKGYKEDGTFFEIGDDGRKANQIKLMKAFIKQRGTISNIKNIPDILDSLGKNVKHSIGLGDVLQTYMKLARDIVNEKYEIKSEVIETEQTWINGSAYVDFK